MRLTGKLIEKGFGQTDSNFDSLQYDLRKDLLPSIDAKKLVRYIEACQDGSAGGVTIAIDLMHLAQVYGSSGGRNLRICLYRSVRSKMRARRCSHAGYRPC
jgi:hypothetical protein